MLLPRMAHTSLKRTTSAFRDLWSIISVLGLNAVILSSLSSGAMAIWSYTENVALPILVAITITTFLLILFGHNWVKFVYRRAKKYPNYDAWDLVDPLPVWQIACLWADREPYAVVAPGTDAYPYLHMLKADINTGQLKNIEGRKNKLLWTRINRATLRKYAAKKKQEPKFLFPGQR